MDQNPQNSHIKNYVVLGTIVLVAIIVVVFVVMIKGNTYGWKETNGAPQGQMNASTTPKLLTDTEKQQIEQRISTTTTATSPTLTAKEKKAIQQRINSAPTPTLTAEEKAQIEARIKGN